MVLPSGFGNKFTYESTVPFTIPGTVTTGIRPVGNSGGQNLILITTPPVQTTCVAEVTVEYTKDSTPSTTGLYQPDLWSSAIINGVGYFFKPISYTNTFSNYIRIGDGGCFTRVQPGPGEPSDLKAIMGQLLYSGVEGCIELSGPTYDPAGKDQLLSVSTSTAFTDADGVQYYKVIRVTAAVPARG